MPAAARESRKSPRTTCDQCGADYADNPASCVTILLPSDAHFCATVCLTFVDALGYTGCSYREGEPVEYVFGRSAPPAGWRGRPSSGTELLAAISSVGYTRRSKPMRDP